MAAQVLLEKSNVYYLALKLKQKTVFLWGYGLPREILLLESILSMKNFYFINPKV